MPNTLNQKQYTKLLNDIQTLQQNSTNKSNHQLVESYWKIGQRIEQEQLSQNADYHNSIIRDLSEDLEIENSLLNRCINFFHLYKSIPKNQTLGWSHYRHLLAVKDQTLRTKLEQEAIKNKWSKNQLLSAIKLANEKKNPNQKTILKRPTNPTYLYQAVVKKVIDGDTLNLYIDLGFDIHKNQRIRLACLDCPELTTKAGKEAQTFVQQKLTNLDHIMIQTQKADIYGRFIAHIFYDPTNKKSPAQIFESGVYLNEELLQNKLAVRI
jgi:micrococcal nuclease